MVDSEWLSVQDVAALLRVNEETVRRWVRTKTLPAIQLGDDVRSGYRFRWEDVDRFLNGRIEQSIGKVLEGHKDKYIAALEREVIFLDPDRGEERVTDLRAFHHQPPRKPAPPTEATE